MCLVFMELLKKISNFPLTSDDNTVMMFNRLRESVVFELYDEYRFASLIVDIDSQVAVEISVEQSFKNGLWQEPMLVIPPLALTAMQVNLITLALLVMGDIVINWKSLDEV